MKLAAFGKHKRTAKPLWLRLSLIAMTATTLVLLVSIGIQRKIHESHGAGEFAAEGQNLVRVISASSLEPIITEDRAELATIVSVLARASLALAGVVISNERGEVLATWRRGQESEEQELPTFAAEVVFEGELFGKVLVTIDPSLHELAYRNNLAKLSASLGAGILVVVLVLLLSIHMLVVRPIQQMSSRLLASSQFRLRGNRRLRAFSDEISALRQATSMSLVQLRSSRRRHDAMQAALEQAECSNRAKTAFLSTMSHELKSPLSAIVGTLHVMRESELAPENLALAEQAETAANAMLSLVNNIVEFARLDAGDRQSKLDAFVPLQELGNIRDLFLPEAEAKGLILIVQSGAAVPARLVGPATRIRQVLVALTGNALKFTQAGEVRLGMTVASRHENGVRLRFTIEDTGIGIDAADQQLIFEPFQQAASGYDRAYSGMGLGLTLAERIVTSLGGAIGLDSLPGTGSCFWFELDMALAPLGEHVIGQDLTADQGSRIVPSGLEVLLVDDSDSNRMVAAAMLEGLGVRVTEADSGQAAVAAVRQQAFDLVLMDLQMPGMDGWEAARQIRMLGHAKTEIPIVALTANTSDHDRERSREAGMASFLCKPVSKPALTDVLCSLAGAGTGRADGATVGMAQ